MRISRSRVSSPPSSVAASCRLRAQDAPFALTLSSVAVGLFAAFSGGYIAGLLAGRRPLAHGVAVALVLAAGATVSLSSTLGHGAIWSQLAALLLMALFFAFQPAQGEGCR